MKKSYLLAGPIFLALSAQAARAEQTYTASSPEGFRKLVTQHASEMSVIRYNETQDRFEVVVFEKDEFKALLGLTGDKLENDTFEMVAGDGPAAMLSPDPVTHSPRQKPVKEVQMEFEAEPTLSISDFDGRNVLYHLMIARDYYTSFDEANPAVHRKIKVRVRVPNDYNVVTHTANTESANNSRYIYADYKGRWSGETWFQVPSVQQDSLTMTVLKTLTERLQLNYGPTDTDPIDNVFQIGLSVPIGGRFVDHWEDIGMDLAKIPSVIYHEAFHWATDDPGYHYSSADKKFVTTSSDPYPFTMSTEGNPLKEDFANYFGSVLNGKPEIAELEAYVDPTRVRDFSGVTPVDESALAPLLAEANREHLSQPYNFTNLIPQILWSFRKAAPGFKEADGTTVSGAIKFDHVVWSLMRKILVTTRPSDMIGIIENEIQSTYGGNSQFYLSAQSSLETYRSSFQALDWLFSGFYKKYTH